MKKKKKYCKDCGRLVTETFLLGLINYGVEYRTSEPQNGKDLWIGTVYRCHPCVAVYNEKIWRKELAKRR